MTNNESGKIEVHESFEKETKIVVIFKGEIPIYERDCSSVREILGQAFPLFLVREEPEEQVIEKWLMRKESWCDNFVKSRNLTLLEEELKKDGISLSYLHADPDRIQYFYKEMRIWRNYLGSWLEDENSEIRVLYDKFKDDGLIERLDIKFDLELATIEAGEEKTVGNHFKIKTKSLKGCEDLKICHKQIVQKFLEVLNSIDGISKVRYYCGDIEHESRSKIACVLDKEK